MSLDRRVRKALAGNSGWSRTIPRLRPEEYAPRRETIREAVYALLDDGGVFEFSDAHAVEEVDRACRGSPASLREFLKGLSRREGRVVRSRPGEWEDTGAIDLYTRIEQTANHLLDRVDCVNQEMIAQELDISVRKVNLHFPRYRRDYDLIREVLGVKDDDGRYRSYAVYFRP